MSHDNWCSDCGVRDGIGYGYCEACTPKEVQEAIVVREQQIKELVRNYGRKGAPARADFKKVVAAYRKLWKDPKRDWTFALW